MMKNIILRDASTNKWLHFTDPVRVLVARKLEEVLPILQIIERWNARGYYIVGYLSYEASAAFDKSLVTHVADDFPLAVFGIYESTQNSKLKTQNPTPKTQNSKNLQWRQSLHKEEYLDHFQTIQQAIRRGDTYQVNFSMRQWADFKGSPRELFQDMATEAPYGAFLDFENYAICSASPELFFSKKGNEVTVRPMKGTIARGLTNADDQQQIEILKSSTKDRAENVMIVDMIRNDLGRIAEAGTVQFPHLYTIEKYPTVWQMTSTVTAQTTANFSQLMTALFPCASITGAPKMRTMQIINQLEHTPRHIYTGSIGFIAPNGDMQFNVAIRTALINKVLGEVEYGMGGGITAQSIAEKEYEECLLKTKIIQQSRPVFELLETMLWTPKEGVFLQERHLNRIEKTAEYFDINFAKTAVENTLKKLLYSTTQKLRLLIAQDGDFRIENYPIEEVSNPTWQVALAQMSIDTQETFLYHKTTNRHFYNVHLAQQPEVKDVILYNEKGELTESCYGNLVLEINGVFYTPPVTCGLLNGTLRQELIDLGWLYESVLYPEDLAEADTIYIINSVRKFIKAKLIVPPKEQTSVPTQNPLFKTQNHPV